MSQRTLLWILIGILSVVLVIGLVVLVGGGLFFIGRATVSRAVPATLTATPTASPAAIPTLGPPTPTPTRWVVRVTATPVPTVAPPATPAAPSATPTSVAIDWGAIGQSIMAWLAEQGVPMKAEGASSAATFTPTPAASSPSTDTPTPVSPTATPTATPVAVAVRPGFEGFPLTAQAFYDSLQTQSCPTGSEWECKNLELSEIHPVYKEGRVNGFEVAREDQVEGTSYHSIKHFWGCVPWGLVFGYMSDPQDRAAMGFTETEIAELGLPKSAVGSGIPGSYCGYLEGISAYRLQPSKLEGFLQTVAERRMRFESAGGETTGDKTAAGGVPTWPTTRGEAWNAVYRSCPDGVECAELKDHEFTVDFNDKDELVAIYARREASGYAKGHDITPFGCANPWPYMQFGQLGRPEERDTLGLTAEEVAKLGFDPDEVGAGIPGNYGLDGQGLCNGLSFYRPHPGRTFEVLELQIAEERK